MEKGLVIVVSEVCKTQLTWGRLALAAAGCAYPIKTKAVSRITPVATMTLGKLFRVISPLLLNEWSRPSEAVLDDRV
jgi:hypothetical protein